MNRLKTKVFILLLIILASICVGCNNEPDPVVIDGKEVIISTENSTLTHGDDTYYYSTNHDLTQITITYPNGAVYTKTYYDEYSSSGGWNSIDMGSVEDLGYIDENVLVDIIKDNNKSFQISENFVLSFLLLLAGLFAAIFPYTAWYISYGWRYKDAEPSDIALFFERIGGIVLIIVGILFLFAN